MKPAAPLTSALLARKGTASPVGFAMATLKVPRPAAVAFSAVPPVVAPPHPPVMHPPVTHPPVTHPTPAAPVSAEPLPSEPTGAPAAASEAMPAEGTVTDGAVVEGAMAEGTVAGATAAGPSQPDATPAEPAAKAEPSTRPAKSPLALPVPVPVMRTETAVTTLPRPSAAQAGEARESARLSLRVDRDRHLRLKLLAVHLQRTAQDILLEALDQHLDRIAPEFTAGKCACRAQFGSEPPGGCPNPGDGSVCERSTSEVLNSPSTSR